MARIIQEPPTTIRQQEPSPANSRRPSGAVLKTTRQFQEQFADLGTINPEVEGVFPTIQPVALFDDVSKGVTYRFDTDIVAPPGTLLNLSLFGQASSLVPETDYDFFRLDHLWHGYTHASGVNETIHHRILVNAPSASVPGGTDLNTFLTFTRSVAAGSYWHASVKNSGQATDMKTVQLGNVTGTPALQASHQPTGLNEGIPVDLIANVRIRYANANNLLGTQRLIGAFTLFDLV